jgi:hypothetical protein
MVEPIQDMPRGVVGFRASGKLTAADYRDVLEPKLREAVEAGETRVLCVPSDFEGLEPGAWIEDVKTGLEVLVRHHSARKRYALVTDVDWIAKATRMFAWMIPGEVQIFDLDHLEDATAWIAD